MHVLTSYLFNCNLRLRSQAHYLKFGEELCYANVHYRFGIFYLLPIVMIYMSLCTWYWLCMIIIIGPNSYTWYWLYKAFVVMTHIYIKNWPDPPYTWIFYLIQLFNIYMLFVVMTRIHKKMTSPTMQLKNILHIPRVAVTSK